MEPWHGITGQSFTSVHTHVNRVWLSRVFLVCFTVPGITVERKTSRLTTVQQPQECGHFSLGLKALHKLFREKEEEEEKGKSFLAM